MDVDEHLLGNLDGALSPTEPMNQVQGQVNCGQRSRTRDDVAVLAKQTCLPSGSRKTPLKCWKRCLMSRSSTRIEQPPPSEELDAPANRAESHIRSNSSIKPLTELSLCFVVQASRSGWGKHQADRAALELGTLECSATLVLQAVVSDLEANSL